MGAVFAQKNIPATENVAGINCKEKNKLLFLKQMWNELMEAATPGEELMTCALRDRRVNLDAKLTEAINDRLTIDEVV